MATIATPIRIIDATTFELLGEVSRYSSLQITRSWHGVGSIAITINRHIKGALDLKVGRIVFQTDRTEIPFIIRSVNSKLDENGKVSEDLEVSGIELKGILGQRITYPPTGQAQDTINGKTELVMKTLVNNNAVSPINPSDVIPKLTIKPSTGRGPTLTWQTRYKNLAEDLSEISTFTGVGWTIGLDIDAKTFVFDTPIGNIRTTGQDVITPAIFSTEFGTIAELTYTESSANFRNCAIVAGQGEGAERRIVTVGNASGLDRHVLFVDARDIPDFTEEEDTEGNPIPRPDADVIADLTARGLQKLAEFEQELYIEAAALQTRGLQYLRNYDLGDIVTIQSREWGLEREARITEIRETYEVSGRKVEVTFGYSKPTLGTVLRQKLDGIAPEITR